jgi:hypothetical protein
MPDRNTHGDDQGTRVGSPDAGNTSRRNDSSGSTGAGAEAAEGIHSADGGRDPGDRTALEGQPTGRADSRSGRAGGSQEPTGSEPLIDRETEHRSGYGGSGGRPVRSSDQREPNSPKPSLRETGPSNQDVRDTKRTAREQLEGEV